MRKTSEKGRNLHRARFSPLTGLLLLLSFYLLVGASTSVAQTPPQQVKIAYASSGINYADWFLAKEKGYFREEGLEPQFIQMRSSIAINAGVTGELQGQASIGSAIRAIQRGAPLRVVAVTLRRPLYWLVVRLNTGRLKSSRARCSESRPSAGASTPERKECWVWVDWIRRKRSPRFRSATRPRSFRRWSATPFRSPL